MAATTEEPEKMKVVGEGEGKGEGEEEVETEEEKTLEQRMKEYEAAVEQRLDPRLPVIMRLDGHCFSSFTRGFNKPYDARIARAMIATATDLFNRFHASTAYTESDEISLILAPPPTPSSSPAPSQEEAAAATTTTTASKPAKKKTKKEPEPSLEFNGRVLKLATLAAAYCSIRFCYHLLKEVESGDEATQAVREKVSRMEAHFDCRVFNVPSMEECLNNLAWRCRDSRRNSKMQWGRAHFSQKQLCGVRSDEAVAMVAQQKGLHWNDAPAHFKWGTLIKRVHVTKQAVDHHGNPVEAIRTQPCYFSTDIRFNRAFVPLLAAKLVEPPWIASFRDTPAV